MSSFLKTVVVATLIAMSTSAAMAAQAGGGSRGGGGSGGGSDPDQPIPYGCLMGGDCNPAITSTVKKQECSTVRVKESGGAAERWVLRCETLRTAN